MSRSGFVPEPISTAPKLIKFHLFTINKYHCQSQKPDNSENKIKNYFLENPSFGFPQHIYKGRKKPNERKKNEQNDKKTQRCLPRDPRIQGLCPSLLL